MKRILRYGVLTGGLLVLFKALEAAFYSRYLSLDTYLLLLGGICIGIGVYAGLRSKADSAMDPEASIASELGGVESPLSKREHEILLLLAEGYSNQQIADKLFISLNTTKTHLKNIYQKLEARRRTEALFRARELGIID
ncbi:MAG: helix-turn-helix domain-containing protein [Calditrichia bacterium]